MTVSSSNVLVIPDIHCPADHKLAIPFLQNVREKYQCDTVISIGDVVDLVSISFHPSMPNHPSPQQEIELAESALSKWHDAFPGITVVAGNHDARIMRKTRSANVPDYLLRPLN
jgi:metallophosphoesterase superfamily enzyme